jgi:transposase
MRSRIEPMKKIARSLRQHREPILKVTMRRSYGFRTFRCLELALYHSLRKLPEPESTHDFF